MILSSFSPPRSWSKTAAGGFEFPPQLLVLAHRLEVLKELLVGPQDLETLLGEHDRPPSVRRPRARPRLAEVSIVVLQGFLVTKRVGLDRKNGSKGLSRPYLEHSVV